jgi:hypothetical protein
MHACVAGVVSLWTGRDRPDVVLREPGQAALTGELWLV